MMKYVTFKGFALYLTFAVAANFMMPADSGTEQWVAYFVALAALALVDVLAFNQGTQRGLELAGEVFKDLCDKKQVKVVRNA